MYAEQFAVVPPSIPMQVQVHGPLPLTAPAVPAEQRLVSGAEINVWPFEGPQAPFSGLLVKANVTVQLAVTGPVV